MGLAISSLAKRFLPSFAAKPLAPSAARPALREPNRRWARGSGAPQLLRLKVVEVVTETPSTKTFVFEEGSLSYTAGQHLTVVAGIGGQTVRRCYSFSSSCSRSDSTVASNAASNAGRPSITVKRVEGGVLSNWLHDHVHAGDELRAMPASGRFTIEPDSTVSRHCVMVAGGVGITPIVSMAETILREEPRSHVTMLYGSRCEGEVIFRDRLAALTAEFAGRLDVVLALDDAPATWNGLSGRLDGDRVLAVVGERVVDEWFVCGPQPMMDSVVAMLSRAGVGEDRIRLERFQYAEAPTVAMPTSPATLVFRASGKKTTARVGSTILEAAELSGVSLPSSCRMGGCGACKVKVDGRVVAAEPNCLTQQEKADGYVLACCSYGDGHVVVRDF